MKKTVKFILMCFSTLIIISFTNIVEANYQSVYKESNGYKVQQGYEWIEYIRKMENAGKVMGLNESLKSDLTASTESNNIDVHMQKNTEYGAMAILSASAEYGKQGTGSERYVGSGTTTGNVYGVYMNDLQGWGENVAGTLNGTNHSYSLAKRYDIFAHKYMDYYSSTSVRFNGDALLNWHGVIYKDFDNNSYSIYRGANATLFSYTTQWNANNTARTSRAVAVTGIGF